MRLQAIDFRQQTQAFWTSPASALTLLTVAPPRKPDQATNRNMGRGPRFLASASSIGKMRVALRAGTARHAPTSAPRPRDIISEGEFGTDLPCRSISPRFVPLPRRNCQRFGAHSCTSMPRVGSSIDVIATEARLHVATQPHRAGDRTVRSSIGLWSGGGSMDLVLFVLPALLARVAAVMYLWLSHGPCRHEIPFLCWN